jgi:hypothetical protein
MDRWGALLYGDPCRECHFIWNAELADTTTKMRSLPDSLNELVADATGVERLPGLGWNVSGYVVHMADNTRIWAERLVAVARGGDAHVVPYDPDLLAVARRYDSIGLPEAKWSLTNAVESWLGAVEEADHTGVVIFHSERGEMDVIDVVAANAHDSYHHLWDLKRILHKS